MKISELLSETATAGAMSSANVPSVPNAHITNPGKENKAVVGSPGKSGTKAPPQAKIVQPKTKQGTAVNALDMKGTSLFGGGTIKRR